MSNVRSMCLEWRGVLDLEQREGRRFKTVPTIRNAQGVECVVIVRTIHFLTFLGSPEELRRLNAIVLEVPQPIA
jgi:hypothetical protein